MLEPEVESRPWEEQLEVDDTAYREQLAYLFERSGFYRTKLGEAGFGSPQEAGGLAEIGALPLTEKEELRASVTLDNPVGGHLCAMPGEIVRIYSTSGTTGTPSYIPLTAGDLENWVTGSARSYAASGIARGERIVSTYNAGPFVAGAALASFERIGLCHIPVGTGNTERLVLAIERLRPQAAVLTPSYAAHLIEWAAGRGIDLAASSVERVLVAGEPGGGEPAFRRMLERGWGARVTEAMGIGDIGVSLWGECEAQDGMHLGARGFVHAELIDPESGAVTPLEDGAEGELVLSHLRHRAAPLLRFRTRDHVQVRSGRCSCGRNGPRIRCVGRTDDMLIVRGVNVFPSAVREVVGQFVPRVSGSVLIKPRAGGVKQQPPLPVSVELARDQAPDAALAEQIRDRLRSVLVVQTAVELEPWGSLERSEYKSRLVQR
ncbi:MAG: phenylacetate-CoA ligase, partial [Gaiellales bacterium]|nr:phenylacetate-CoA ligase [Gaiellales bacterium]